MDRTNRGHDPNEPSQPSVMPYYCVLHSVQVRKSKRREQRLSRLQKVAAAVTEIRARFREGFDSGRSHYSSVDHVALDFAVTWNWLPSFGLGSVPGSFPKKQIRCLGLRVRCVRESHSVESRWLLCLRYHNGQSISVIPNLTPAGSFREEKTSLLLWCCTSLGDICTRGLMQFHARLGTTHTTRLDSTRIEPSKADPPPLFVLL